MAFATLGCRLNQYESESLAADFVQAGYTVVPFQEEADVYVINTCSITGKGEAKSRNQVNRARKRHPRALVAVTGCSVAYRPDTFTALPGVDLVVDNAHKHGLLQLVEAHLQGQVSQEAAVPGDIFGFRAARGLLRTRSMIKIQDGCDHCCSYCVVPQVRGPARSRPLAAVLAQARTLLAGGSKEIVLTGINLTRYRDREHSLFELLEELLELPGDYRVRLASLEPEGFDRRLLELFAHPRLCPSMHLCLQSGSDRILTAMGRRYSGSEYLRLVAAIRERIPRFNLTTDVIVGFPGETDADFEASCKLVQEAGFSHVHTFAYSPRTGTPAAGLPHQVAAAVKAERSRILRALSAAQQRAYLQQFTASRERVLVETINHGQARGLGEHYLRVQFPLEHGEPNQFHTVIITGLAPGGRALLLAHTGDQAQLRPTQAPAGRLRQ